MIKRVLLFSIVAAVLALSVACGGSSSKGQGSNPKFNQYFVHGEELYTTHCSNCHQKSGVGLGRVYPPLNKSDFVDAHVERVLCVIKNGIKGELIVNGKSFNQEMKAPGLTDLEIAEIATYIYNSWQRDKGIIEVNDVTRMLMQCDTLSAN